MRCEDRCTGPQTTMAGRTYRRWPGTLLLATTLALASCGDTPTRSPERVVYPRGDGEATDSPAAPDPGPGPTDIAVIAFEAIDTSLFAPVREALAAGDWIRAHLALPSIAATPAGTEPAGEAAPATATELWITYYRARIDHLRGNREGYQRALAALLQSPLPEDLARDLALHRLEVAERANDARRQYREASQLLRLGGHPRRSPDACLQAIWRAAQDLSAGGLRGAAERADPNLGAWLATHAQHPAAPLAEALRDAALRDATSAQLALTLPLSETLAAAGDAVTRGFLAAFYADSLGNTQVDVIDSRRYEPVDAAITHARDGGAAVVVGPLGKRQVGDVIARSDGSVPILTLNRPEQDAAADHVLQLALAPEDEARQLAGNAFAEGARRALLIRPEGVWGERIEAALRARWQELGGRLPTTALYRDPADYSDTLRDALALDRSAARSAELRRLFGGGLETSGRRRADLDAVFLLTRSGDEARALKPLIDYHYAGDLPVYALSTADSGGRDRNRDRDLEGLRLLVMPWRLAPDTVPGLAGEGGSFDALHALGADAFDLARSWWRLRSTARPLAFGHTARLQSDEDGVLRRRLAPAEFDRGVLTAR